MKARHLSARCLVALAVLGAPALSISAQSAQPWSVQGSVLFANQNLNGKLISGVGFEGQFRYTPSVWSVGAGIQYSTHASGGQTLDLTGFFVEPRYALDVGSDRFAPYLAGRAALLHASIDLGSAGNVSTSGVAFGAGAGLIIKASTAVNFDFGAAILSQSLSNTSTVQFTTFTGYIVKGGISVGFGGK